MITISYSNFTVTRKEGRVTEDNFYKYDIIIKSVDSTIIIDKSELTLGAADFLMSGIESKAVDSIKCLIANREFELYRLRKVIGVD